MKSMTTQVSFTSTHVRSFRRSANKVFKELKDVIPGSSDYTPELRSRLLNVIYKAKDVNSAKITMSDSMLHESLKKKYKLYQEADDFVDAMIAPCGGHYIDRTLDIKI